MVDVCLCPSTDRKFASTHHIKIFDKHLKARFGAARQALCSLRMLIQCVSVCPAGWQFTRLRNREKGGKRRTLQLESINLPRCFPLNEHQMCEWFDNGRSAYNRPAAFLLGASSDPAVLPDPKLHRDVVKSIISSHTGLWEEDPPSVSARDKTSTPWPAFNDERVCMLSVSTFFISYDSVLKVLCINRDSYLKEIANAIVVSSSGCLDGFQLAQARVILCLLVAAQQLSSRLVTQNLNMFLDWNEGSHFNHSVNPPQ